MADGEMIELRLVQRILTKYTLPHMGIHGLPHWSRVLDTGMKLAELTGADPKIVALFSVFHDAGRRNDSHDPNHGQRGSEIAASFRNKEFGLSDDDFGLLQYACKYHTDGLTNAHITIQTCWDADRLDLWRVDITPRSELLCTDAAQTEEIRKWSRTRSQANFVPTYVTKKWLRGADHAV